MHLVWSVGLIIAAVIVLGLALVAVLRDLLLRGPFDAPLLGDEDLNWPRRHQRVAPQDSQDGVDSASPTLDISRTAAVKRF